MLIWQDTIHSCIVCGHDTYIIETRTNQALCDDECRFSLWLDNMYSQNQGAEIDNRR